MEWMACENWDDLPVGSWLVKIDKDRKPYNVAEVAIGGDGKSRIIIVGNCFHWDMGSIVAYTAYKPYNKH